MLEIERLSSGYGKLKVLQDISLSVREREIVVMLGANGAGKSTLLRTLSGLIVATGGSARFDGEELVGQPAHILARKGISHVPEGRGIFAEQSVQDNLELGAFGWARGHRARMAAEFDRVYGLFPILAERRHQRAGTLSGGQQQMVAIGRALMARPKLVMLDEPSLGLAPLVVAAIFETIRQLRDAGTGDPSCRAECARGLVVGGSRLRAEHRKDRRKWHRPRACRRSADSTELSRRN